MFKLLLTALQLIWPFVKESVLEGGTLRDWVRRNRIACLWIFLLLAMFSAMIWMADIIVTISKQNSELVTKNQTLTGKYNGLVTKYNNQLGQTKLERNRVAGLRRLIADSCPADSAAYRVLVVGVESLDQQATTNPDGNVEWCNAVRQGDLTNEAIRQRYLVECGTPRS